jgi:hypothetical protein
MTGVGAGRERGQISSFVWALYHAFDERERWVLNDELKVQCVAINRAVSSSEGVVN